MYDAEFSKVNIISLGLALQRIWQLGSQGPNCQVSVRRKKIQKSSSGYQFMEALSTFRAWARGSYLLYGNSQVIHKTHETVTPARTICEAM